MRYYTNDGQSDLKNSSCQLNNLKIVSEVILNRRDMNGTTEIAFHQMKPFLSLSKFERSQVLNSDLKKKTKLP